MSKYTENLETRVRHSLARLNLDEISVTHVGDGVVQLAGNDVKPNDKSMAIATVRSVPGVRNVKF